MILADAAAAPPRTGGAPAWVPVARALYGDPGLAAVFGAVASCASWERGLVHRYRATARWIASTVARCDVRTAASRLQALQRAELVSECAGGGYVLTEAGADLLRPGGSGFGRVRLAELEPGSATAWRDALTLATMRDLLHALGGRGQVTVAAVVAAQRRWLAKASVRLEGVRVTCARTVRAAWSRLTARGVLQRARKALWQPYTWVLKLTGSKGRPQAPEPPSRPPSTEHPPPAPQRGPPEPGEAEEVARQSLAIVEQLQRR